jgi:hypothetical protein
MVQHLEYRADGASFWIWRSVHQPAKPGVHHGSCTHWARLERNEQFTVLQAMAPNALSGFPQSHDFCVGAGIRIRNIPITAAGYNLAFADHDGAHRHLADGLGSLSFT